MRRTGEHAKLASASHGTVSSPYDAAEAKNFLKRLAEIHVPVVEIDADSVTIMGVDYGKVIVLTKGGQFFTSPVGTDRIRLR